MQQPHSGKEHIQTTLYAKTKQHLETANCSATLTDTPIPEKTRPMNKRLANVFKCV